MRMKVAHLSPHRDPFEPRMFWQARSLAETGHDAVIVAPHPMDETRHGVRVLGIERYKNKLERITITCWRCVRRAMQEKPDIYHLHEPDLIPLGLMLRLLGKRVVYDVHEDYAAAATVRRWLPDWARRPLAGFVHTVNWLAQRSFTVIIAERYYERFFPGSVQVLNYARLREYEGLQTIQRKAPPAARILYTGSVTDVRGGRHHARLLEHLPADAEIMLIGQCSMPDLKTELETMAASDSRLKLVLSEGWIPRDTIAETYQQDWTCGLALFPDTPHYREKELTKFFEYMAAGIPIIASDFPVWRQLIEGEGVGLCVDPEDPKAAANAIAWLVAHPEKACEMGERGRQAVASTYNWGSQAKRLIDLYQTMLQP